MCIVCVKSEACVGGQGSRGLAEVVQGTGCGTGKIGMCRKNVAVVCVVVPVHCRRSRNHHFWAIEMCTPCVVRLTEYG